MTDEAQQGLHWGSGWVVPTSDAGYVGVDTAQEGNPRAVPLPQQIQRALGIAEAAEQRDEAQRVRKLRQAVEDKRDYAASMVAMGLATPRSVEEIFADAERRGRAADYRDEQRRQAAALAATDDPVEAFSPPRAPQVVPVVPPLVKRYQEQSADPFMSRMIAEHDARLQRQAEAELRRERIRAEDRVREVTR